MSRIISVRLEGGIGDHILGMRLLSFIKQRYPKHKIVAYSDAGGSKPQLEVARMSPLLTKVIPIYQKKKGPTLATWGSLRNIQQKYIKMMFSSDLFLDTFSENFFIRESKILNLPFYKILAHTPELSVPERCRIKADRILAKYKNSIFIGLNVAKYELGFLSHRKAAVLTFLKELLKDRRVVILNFYTSSYKFPHWPKPLRIKRELYSEDDRQRGELWNIDSRVIPLVDMPILMVAALLQRCSYFIGVDNGIKHLAWALSIPRTFFLPFVQDNTATMRWIPDHNRSLLFSCSRVDLLSHILSAQESIRNPCPTSTSISNVAIGSVSL